MSTWEPKSRGRLGLILVLLRIRCSRARKHVSGVHDQYGPVGNVYVFLGTVRDRARDRLRFLRDR